LVPAGSKIYAEVVTPAAYDYMMGYTDDGSNTDQAYVSCGSDVPYTTLASIGYSDVSPIISLDGEEYNVITPVQVEGLPSGSVFPVGTTTNTFEVTSANGITSSCSFDVVVEDNEVPVITCPVPEASYGTDEGECSASLSFTATATDNCSAEITYSLDEEETEPIVFPYLFSLGTTTIFATATDPSGNKSQCEFDVTVVSSQMPEIICTDNQLAEADMGVCTYTHSGTGWDATPVLDCNIASLTYELTGTTTGNGTSLDGMEFNLGDTTVTWIVTDNEGNTDTCSFIVTVEDNQAPEISCTVNQLADADLDECSYIHSGTAWDATATDNCTIDSVTYELSGATTGNGTSLDGVEFNVGETTVNWTVTDESGNTSVCSFTVTVEDNQAPEIICTSNQTVDVSTDDCSYLHSGTSWDAPATDNCTIASITYELTGATTGNGTSLDGVEFNVGETTVNWTVTDGNGNTSVCSFTVTVEDNQAPVAICVDSLIVQLDEDGQATITTEDVDNGSFDNCSGVSLEINQTSFDCSDIGENNITLTVTDNNGNLSTCTTTVTVEDNIAPEIFCPDDLIVNVPQGETYIVPDYFADGDASATDNCLVSMTQSPEAGTELGDGTHIITLTAIDPSGNETHCSFGLEVQELGIQSYDMKSLTMYPNPARTTVTIANPTALGIIQVNIFDLQGRLLYSMTPQNIYADVEVNISGLETGTYMVNIKNNKGGEIFKKLLKR